MKQINESNNYKILTRKRALLVTGINNTRSWCGQRLKFGTINNFLTSKLQPRDHAAFYEYTSLLSLYLRRSIYKTVLC